MITGGDSDGGWRVAYEAAVDFDVGGVGSGGDLQLRLHGGCGRGIGGHRRRWLLGLELGDVELHVAAHVGGDFGAFGDADVFAVHEEEERRGGEEDEAGGHDAAGHGGGVASALYLFYGAEGGFFGGGRAGVGHVGLQL